MTLNLECICMHGHSVDSLIDLLQSNSFNGFPVVTSTNEMLVVGYISRVDLCNALEVALSNTVVKVYGSTMCYFAMVEMRFPKNNTYVDLSGVVDQTPVLLVESTPFERICRAFTSLGIKYCLVIRQGRLVGLLTRKTLYKYVHEHKEIEDDITPDVSSIDEDPAHDIPDIIVETPNTLILRKSSFGSPVIRRNNITSSQIKSWFTSTASHSLNQPLLKSPINKHT